MVQVLPGPVRGPSTQGSRHIRIKVVSDIHGAADRLRAEAADADALIVLGDLVNLLDYVRMEGPIVDAYGVQAVTDFVALRNASRFDEAGLALRAGSIGREREVGAIIRSSVRSQYEQVFAAFPDRTYLTHGNVDSPELFADLLRPGVRHLDGEAVELDGLTFGFVGGGLPRGSRVHLSEQTHDAFTEKVALLPRVDVLCSHMPPAIDDLRFDLLAGRPEPGSTALLDYVRTHQPAFHYFGHVHQPRRSRLKLGRTWLVNAGYFRGGQGPLVHPAADGAEAGGG